jgi:hypothetical protein
MPTAVAKRRTAGRRPVESDFDRIVALMQKDEPLRADLRPYLERTNTVLGTILRHPLYVGPVDPRRAALAHEVIDTRRKLLDESLAAGEWGSALSLYEPPFRLDGFLEHAGRFDDASFWKMLGFTWGTQEQVWPGRGAYLTLFRSPRPGREALMDAADHEALARLPAEFPVYRGFQGRGRRGLSWTTSRATAEWFARRFEVLDRLGEPQVVSGVARKEDVLAYFGGRGESEVVIDPAAVRKQRVEALRGR